MSNGLKKKKCIIIINALCLTRPNPCADFSTDKRTFIKTSSKLMTCYVCLSNVIHLINMQMRTLTKDL